MKTKMRMTALFLAVSLLLPACSGGTAATTMKLAKTEGTVGVSDEEGQDVTPAENLGLYSGYKVDTQSASYAWVNLDDVKLTKLDEDTEIEITKDGKKLEIEVKSGALFFNVTEPLVDDETLDIRSSTMMVGIRGTCGWVSVEDPDHMTLYLLEGTVECTAGENTATVTAGEKAEMSTDGEIVVSSFYQEHIPAFVAEENLDEAVLIEVPPLYPLTVLTRQTIEDNEQICIADYFYDEAGYTLRREDKMYYLGELQETSTVTYSYDGEGNFLLTHSEGYTSEVPYEPGTVECISTYNWVFANPMVTGNYYDMRSEIGPDGRLELSADSDYGMGDGYYAMYTMDANNYPVYIETYAPDGTLTGTCTLEWAVIG